MPFLDAHEIPLSRGTGVRSTAALVLEVAAREGAVSDRPEVTHEVIRNLHKLMAY